MEVRRRGAGSELSPPPFSGNLSRMSNYQPSDIDFIVVGAEKSGTTWLADMLRQHPDVFIPPEKEIFYFNRRFFESPELENFNHTKPASWYLAFFDDARPEQAKGEVCPAYLWDEAAPEAIQAFNPQIKIAAVLRDPVERAYSQYRYYVQRGVLGDVSFRTAIEQRPDLLSRSAYADQVARYLSRFPRDRVQIMLFDQIMRNNRAFLRSIESFLGVDAFIPANVDARANVTGEPRFAWLNRAMSRLRYALRKHTPPALINLLRATGLAQLSETIRLKNTQPAALKTTIDPALDRELRAYFLPNVERLEGILGKDLSSWKKKSAEIK